MHVLMLIIFLVSASLTDIHIYRLTAATVKCLNSSVFNTNISDHALKKLILDLSIVRN